MLENDLDFYLDRPQTRTHTPNSTKKIRVEVKMILLSLFFESLMGATVNHCEFPANVRIPFWADSTKDVGLN